MMILFKTKILQDLSIPYYHTSQGFRYLVSSRIFLSSAVGTYLDKEHVSEEKPPQRFGASW